MDGINIVGTASNASHRVYSNFFSDYSIIQQVLSSQPKNLLIDTLREVFRRDNVYTYRSDPYGYPLTPSQIGLNNDSTETTKILISDQYRYEIKFYPGITIKNNGGSYKPVSFNQEGTIKYRKDLLEDEFGGRRIIHTPTHRVYAGFWELSFEIAIYSESHSELEELVDIVSLILQHTHFHDLRAAGLIIKSCNVSAESAEPYANDYVYSQSITISTLSEWRVEIPIDNVIEKIVFYFDSVMTPSPDRKDELESQLVDTKYSELVQMAEIS
jgi:hypothetical protein